MLVILVFWGLLLHDIARSHINVAMGLRSADFHLQLFGLYSSDEV